MYYDAGWTDLPFEQAIDYIRSKVNLPTAKWDDIKGEMHVRAFVVAGAMESDLLCDLHTAVDKAIADGTSLGEFRRDFRKIVKKHGWAYNGNESWRTATIYNTNLRTAFAAGRWQQIEEASDIFPYVVYRTMDDGGVRPQHKKWHGIIVRVGSQWLLTYYPPNGWGCRCYVEQLTEDEAMELLGQDGYTDEAPDPEYVEKISPRTGEVQQVVPGIDPGWDYNVGVSTWGSQMHAKSLADGASGWESMSKTDYKTYNRPKVPVEKTDIRPMTPLKSRSEAVNYLTRMYGEERVFTLKQGDFTHQILMNSGRLGSHFKDKDMVRTRFLPYLEDVITNPFEVWISFEKSKKTGKVALRFKYIKAYDIGEGKGFLAVIEAHKGFLTGWTFLPMDELRKINSRRKGFLLYGK